MLWKSGDFGCGKPVMNTQCSAPDARTPAAGFPSRRMVDSGAAQQQRVSRHSNGQRMLAARRDDHPRSGSRYRQRQGRFCDSVESYLYLPRWLMRNCQPTTRKPTGPLYQYRLRRRTATTERCVACDRSKIFRVEHHLIQHRKSANKRDCSRHRVMPPPDRKSAGGRKFRKATGCRSDGAGLSATKCV